MMRLGKWSLLAFIMAMGLLFLAAAVFPKPAMIRAETAPAVIGGEGLLTSEASSSFQTDDDEDDDGDEDDEDEDDEDEGEDGDSDEDEMEFEGIVASISNTRIVLEDGSSFLINDATEIEGDVKTGGEVDIEAIMLASTLEHADTNAGGLDFGGVVASITVMLEDGSSFLINGDTSFDNPVTVGTRVDINAVMLALEIEADDDEDEDDDADEMDDESEDEDDGDNGDAEDGDEDDDAGFKSNGIVRSVSSTSIGLNTGRFFRLTSETRMDSGVQVGAQVQVTFEIRMGIITAKSVKVTSPASDIDFGSAQAQVTNRYFLLNPLDLFVYEGEEDGVDTSVEIRVLPGTMEIGGMDVTVALVEEYEDGDLIERTLDFYAQLADGTVIYVGEYVDEIENGVVINHAGQWIAGEGNSLAGIFMPANPKVGDRFEQERAPGLAEDESRVIAVGLDLTTPAGSYNNCIKTEDFDPLGGGIENKFYCPGVGLVREEEDGGETAFLDLVSVGTFSASELDQNVIDAIGRSEVPTMDDGSASLEIGGLNLDDYRDEDGDLIAEGVVASVTDTQVTLTNGMTFAITSTTRRANRAQVGQEVEIEFRVSGGQLVAVEID
jgi:hypothetical protein